jgi:hypothetical protein
MGVRQSQYATFIDYRVKRNKVGNAVRRGARVNG